MNASVGFLEEAREYRESKKKEGGMWMKHGIEVRRQAISEVEKMPR